MDGFVNNEVPCPCQSGRAFAACCEPVLLGHPAAGPEALMRSRYTAFTRCDLDYLERTTDPEYRASFDREANREWAENARFTGLKVLRASQNGNDGLVEFQASFELEGQSHVHHELSTFRRHGEQWYFCEGQEPPN